MDSGQGTLRPGRMMAGYVSLACHGHETIAHPKGNGKPLKGFRLRSDHEEHLAMLKRGEARQKGGRLVMALLCEALRNNRI